MILAYYGRHGVKAMAVLGEKHGLVVFLDTQLGKMTPVQAIKSKPLC
jgi:hypothetical protein